MSSMRASAVMFTARGAQILPDAIGAAVHAQGTSGQTSNLEGTGTTILVHPWTRCEMTAKTLTDMRGVLKRMAAEIDVLPAVGGATEDYEQPHAEEVWEHAISHDEVIFDAIYEREPSGKHPPLYRAVTPLPRTQEHLFRYFLDGSFRSYFLGTILEHDRESPVHFAQIGACAVRRENDGTMRREGSEVRPFLFVGKQRVSEKIWRDFEHLTSEYGITLVDLTERDIGIRVFEEIDLRSRATGRVRFEMHNLEASLISQVFPKLRQDAWLIVDGSLLFQPTLSAMGESEGQKPVIGVAKNFRKDPQFVYGHGPRAERRSVYRLLADLEFAHRTAAFSSSHGRVSFWYVRIHEQEHMDYPVMGVVKVELPNPGLEPPSSELVNKLSCALMAEGRVTPHGLDPRWHAHIYPIFLAERCIKESLLGWDVVQRYLRWR